HAARVLGQRPRLAAGGVEQPDLGLRPLVGLALRFRRRPAGEEGDVPAVGRPAWRRTAVGPAGQLDLAAAGEGGPEEVADVLVFVLVGGGLDPDGTLAIRREPEVRGGLLPDDVISGPLLDVRWWRRGGAGGEGEEENGQEEQGSAHGRLRRAHRGRAVP